MTDDKGAAASDTMIVTVKSVSANSPPLISAGINRTIVIGISLTLAGIGKDHDGENASDTMTVHVREASK